MHYSLLTTGSLHKEPPYQVFISLLSKSSVSYLGKLAIPWQAGNSVLNESGMHPVRDTPHTPGGGAHCSQLHSS
jgi:hypothetical protein